MKKSFIGIVMLLYCPLFSGQPENDYPIRPVPFTAVHVDSGFWFPRLEANRKVTIPFGFQKCEETNRIANFEIAAGLRKGSFEGRFYNDSDVYKIIEGAAYSLSVSPDPEMEDYLDALIAKIVAAQEDDGYLYTIRTINPDHEQIRGEERWENLKDKHELYNVGHLYEAAVAYYQSTGKRTLLDVAIKNADLVADVFGPGKNMGVPGHEEIEIGLVKLYRITGDRKYLDLAEFFIDQRGNFRGHGLYGRYAQDHLPVIDQTKASGHAVRAGYLYTGMTDVAAIVKKRGYIEAAKTIWEDIVTKKMYITGSVGASSRGEAYGEEYDLPNAAGYNETCAAIADMFFNYRLFLLEGDGKYIDVFERSLYNGFLAGVSMEGDRFFYCNPLASDGEFKFNAGLAATRAPWFNTSCCPTNVSRFMPSIPGYIYATVEDTLYINLFINSVSSFRIGDQEITISQKSNYPWNGTIDIELNLKHSLSFTLLVRIPGWLGSAPLPGDLYRYVGSESANAAIEVNGQSERFTMQKGYACIRRKWGKGDVVRLELPLDIRRVVAHDRVMEDRGRVALVRGPIVYCVEGVDNGGRVNDFVLTDNAVLTSAWRENLLNGVMVLRTKLPSFEIDGERNTVVNIDKEIQAIPYYAWSHRGENEMAVWLPRKIARVTIVPE